MNDITDLLNGLLVEEQRSLAPRLLESTVFVSTVSVADFQLIQRVAKSTHEHCAALTELILELGASPWPRSAEIKTADLHFQEIRCTLARLQADLVGLLDLYAHAATRASRAPGASDLIARIREDHERDLIALRKQLETGAAA